jgi:hypothetical protein
VIPAASYGIASPWSGTSHLAPAIVWDDIFNLDTRPVGRAEAMSVPAVAKARRLVCETLARYPQRAYQDDVLVSEQPGWTYRTDTAVAPRLRMLWTLDDLFFYGWSLWGVQRGADNSPLDFWRVPKEWWNFDSSGQILVQGEVADASKVVLIPGPFEGMLTAAARTIRGATKLEEQWSARVENPIPLTEIRYTGEEDLSPDEMSDIRDTYIEARSDKNGVVTVTPKGFEVHVHGDQALNLFIEGRNNASLDIARFANIPAAMLDASQVNGSSVDYENVGVGRGDFVNITLRSWALPIEERLSMDDVCPRGTRVAFDLSELVTAPDTGTGPRVED